MGAKFERFTPEARHALILAQAEARRLGHSRIGSEHLLLGLIGVDGSVAVALLNALGVDLGKIHMQIERSITQGQREASDKPDPTLSLKQVFQFAVDEANSSRDRYIGTEHLLLGLLREGSGIANQVLQETGVSLEQVRTGMESVPRRAQRSLSLEDELNLLTPHPQQRSIKSKIPAKISPAFGLIILATMIAGYLLYRGEVNYVVTILLLVAFVAGGWIVSLSLHEFGHAVVAFWGGDRAVVEKGYLTLNPLKYTDVTYSILLPLMFLAMGGIGLPGGAVYVNTATIRSKHMRSLTSAAGPIATLLCAIILFVPFVTRVVNVDRTNHFEFWSGLALLAFLQITSVFLSLLPIPGLDGFGIIEPFLPELILSRMQRYRSLTFVVFFLLFFNDNPLRQAFWSGIKQICSLVNLDFDLVVAGLRLFQFWTI